MSEDKANQELYPDTIFVTIEKMSGWYMAKSDDLPGFNVADPEFGVVAGQIVPVIKAFYKEKFGEIVRVEQEKTSTSNDDCDDDNDPLSITYTARRDTNCLQTPCG